MPTRNEIVSVGTEIVRVNGETGTATWLTEDQQFAVDSFDWLLPRNGQFTLNDLAKRIVSTHDRGNPKTAWAVRQLGLEEGNHD